MLLNIASANAQQTLSNTAWMRVIAYAASSDRILTIWTAAGTVCAHPVFPVCLEWPPVLATRALLGDQPNDAESAQASMLAMTYNIFH